MAWGASSVQDAVAGVLFGEVMKVKECVSGAKCGRLTVLFTFIDGAYLRAECQCDCGKKCSPIITNIRPDKQVSCGCLRAEKSKRSKHKTHGQSNRKRPTSEYWAWGKMIQRCRNKNNPYYKNYGERGIFVCDRWANSFEAFFEDMGSKPSPHYSIDRINNNDGYYKENCRWATREEQMVNRSAINLYSFRGKMLSMSQIDRELGFTKSTIQDRIRRGWSFDRATSTPIHRHTL